MKFTPFPTLTSSRLLLREMTLADREEVFFLRSDSQVNQYIDRPPTLSLADADNFIQKIKMFIEKDESIYWSITLRDQPKMIGSICLWNFSKDEKTAEVGYDLAPAFQQQGMMSEALTTILDFGFKQLKLNRIEAFTHRQNEASKKLLIRHGFLLQKNRKDEDNADNEIFCLNKNGYIE